MIDYRKRRPTTPDGRLNYVHPDRATKTTREVDPLRMRRGDVVVLTASRSGSR